MKTKLPCALLAAGVLSLGALSGARAFPPYGGPGPFYGPYGYGPRPFFPRYGYGYRFGPYGLRRGLPNGTGYRGRGTFTGGPAGGLPSRN